MFSVFNDSILPSPFTTMDGGYIFAKSVIAPNNDPFFLVDYDRKLHTGSQLTLELFSDINTLKNIVRKGWIRSVYLVGSPKVEAEESREMYLVSEVKEVVISLQDVQLKKIICKTVNNIELSWLVSKAKKTDKSENVIYKRLHR